MSRRRLGGDEERRAGGYLHGLKNKLEVAAAGLMTDATTAKLHRAQVEPGSGTE